MSTNELAVRNGHDERERSLFLQLNCDPVAARQKRFHHQHDAGNHILDANCVYDAGVFELFCLPGCPDLFTVRFTTPRAYAAGETVRIGEDSYQVRTVDGEAAPGGVFAAGAVVRCDVDREQGMVFFSGVVAADGMGRDEIEDALAAKADRTAGFVDCDSQTVAGVIELTPRAPVADPLPDRLTLRFAADAACEDGCVVRFNGVAYPLLDTTKAALKAGSFAAGALVDVHLHEGNAFFNRGVGDGSGPGVNPGLEKWNISTGDDAVPVSHGIHVPEAVRASGVIVDENFYFRYDSSLKSISCNMEYTLMALNDGTVVSCGKNSGGRLARRGAGNLSLGVSELISNVASVMAGYNASYFLKNDGTVWTCGNNSVGQLGVIGGNDSATNVTLRQIPIPKRVVKLAKICSSSAAHFICEDGTVWNCGENIYGELGRAVESGSSVKSNLGQVPITEVIDVVAGSSHTLFLKADGTVWGCGFNYSGELGTTTSLDRKVPLTHISELSGIIQMAAGNGFSIFLDGNGQVFSCGSNIYGQLGRDTQNATNTESNLGRITDIIDVIQVDCGLANSSFLQNDGKVWNCGDNRYADLGRTVENGDVTYYKLPLGTVENLPKVKRLISGRQHSFFIVEDNSLYGCGSNTCGELMQPDLIAGNPAISNLELIPIDDIIAPFTPIRYEPRTFFIKYGIDFDDYPPVKLYENGNNSMTLRPKMVYQIQNDGITPKRLAFHVIE